MVVVIFSVAGAYALKPSPTADGPARAVPTVVDPTSPVATKALPPAAPLRLRIPAIAVDTTVHRLGLTPDGSLDVPKGKRYDQAGWYGGSPSPGSLGPAVIVGHVDSAKDGPSVFFRLAKVKARDAILVTRQDGSVAQFVVDSVKSYRKTAFPTQLVYGNTDHPALRLITCGGFFDRNAGSYTENIVVLAHLIPPADAPAQGFLAQRTR